MNIFRLPIVLSIYTSAIAILVSLVYMYTHRLILESEDRIKVTELAKLRPNNWSECRLIKLSSLRYKAEHGLNLYGDYLIVNRSNKDPNKSLVIIEASNKYGYSGPIVLAMAIYNSYKIYNLEILQESETPGIGDYINPLKDQQTPKWIEQFNNYVFTKYALLTVKKRGGDFDSIAEASISPEAVLKTIAYAINILKTNKSIFTCNQQNEF